MKRVKRAVWATVAAGSMTALLGTGLFALRISHALQASRQEVRSQNEIEFLARPYAPAIASSFERLSTPAEFGHAELFQGNLYISGPEGLEEYSPGGKLVREFEVGRDLPSSRLVGLTQEVLADSQEEELIVATAEEGLLAYNGRSFRQIYSLDKAYREITCVIAGGSGHLLMGTKTRGVLVFDGKKFAELHPSLAKVYATALAGNESDLWVGTLDRGVLHWHAGETESFGEQEGMPDSQVLSIALQGDNAYVGTAMGVGFFEAGKFSRVIAAGIFATALLPTTQRLMVGTEDEGVLAVPLEAGYRNAPIGEATATAETAEVRQLFRMGDEIYVLTRSELYRINTRGLGWKQVLQRSPATLTDRNLSALAVDTSGNLWIGYFNRGLDEWSVGSGRVTHVEDEHVFCVNRIFPEAKTGTVDVATANGLVRFSAAGNEEQTLTQADGLIAEHVTDVAAYGDGLVLATPAGLTFLDRDGARSLYAFQGLVNNHVFALGVRDDEILAGTLGGISVVGHEEVQTNYTVGNSGLKHNWITAIVRVGNEWMVGTYGAGVLKLDDEGRFYSMEKATGAFDVNPNAMLETASHVFAGTLERGLYVYDRTSGRWSAITDGLPSKNVTALAASAGYLYIGTDNGLVRIEEQKLQP
jgi:ligand-binding sensor domain-containing protein